MSRENILHEIGKASYYWEFLEGVMFVINWKQKAGRSERMWSKEDAEEEGNVKIQPWNKTSEKNLKTWNHIPLSSK